LVFWSPFILIGIIGLIRIPDREIKLSAITYTFIFLLVLGYRLDWFGGGGYGQRYFIELLPIVAVGFACLLLGFITESAGMIMVVICSICSEVHQSVLIYSVE